MAECKYDSLKHAHMMPVHHTVNGISLHNVDPRQTPLINSLIMKKVVKDKKKRGQIE